MQKVLEISQELILVIAARNVLGPQEGAERIETVVPPHLAQMKTIREDNVMLENRKQRE